MNVIKKWKKEDTDKIYDIIDAIISSQEFLIKNNDKSVKVYLINKIFFDPYKNNIHYEELKNFVEDKNEKQFLQAIKKFLPINLKYIIPCIFEKSEHLLNALTKNHYNVIDINLGNKICKKRDNEGKIIKETTISYINKNNNIYIYFKNSDYLKFKINNNDFIIHESNLVETKINGKITNRIKNQKELTNIKKNIQTNDHLIEFKKKYKYQLEILLRLFLYYKDIKEKEKNGITELSEKNKEIVYLINKEWIEKFKIFFEYENFKLFISKEYDLDKINSNCQDEILENVIENLPPEYLNKIKNKIANNSINTISKIIDEITQEEYNVKIEENLVKIKFFTNFQIINQKIQGLLNILGYDANTIKADMYILGNEKILLSFQNQKISKGMCDEFGFINQQNIFSQKFLFYYIAIH